MKNSISDLKEDPTTPIAIPSTISMEQRNAEIEKINEAIMETLSVTDEKKYIKALTYKLAPLWWKNVAMDLSGTDIKARRAAMIELNKLQCRILPNELAISEDSGIVFQVLTYKKEIPPEIIEGDITEGEIEEDN